MFTIHTIPPDAAEFSEQMGTKYKFWFKIADTHHLFKEGRPNTGENWAEKLACEFAEMLGIPHASYELAQYEKKFGVLSPSFVPPLAQLFHGNELVLGRITGTDGNDKRKYYTERSHTASRVFEYFKQNIDTISPPIGFKAFDGVTSALDIFVGYILFDAWIANQDRHSENWGVIKTTNGLFLAPSYDHGSSMGRNETDQKRLERLTTKDQGQSLNAYILRARSSLFPNASSDKRIKPYSTYELFEFFSKGQPVAANAWLRRLSEISMEKINTTINMVPEEHMSLVAKKFTAQLLELNINRLLALKTS
ncbi:HipA domain-containing protein [Undibacterium sp. Ji83W]|uniref:HipA domain-containing protein n=1 Tax=Undibacterium sp. Ji83W TaxID=3413043 RepID=UPI003BEFCF3E